MRDARIWYANVFVGDLERAVRFYRDVLGLPLVFEDAQAGYASFSPAGLPLGIARVEPDAPDFAKLVGRHTGIGFGVPDVDAAHRELSAKSVRFPMAPARQPWGGYMATFADPDGNVFYLDQRDAASIAAHAPPAHPNAVRIRELFAAFRARDLDAIRAAIAEDAVWHFPGRSGRIAGAHAGHAGIFAFLARVMELTGGTFGLEIETVLADDEHAVVFFRGHGDREGRTLDNPTCLKIRMRDGRAVEIHEFVWDLYAVDAFWS